MVDFDWRIAERIFYESTFSVHRMVHFARALLARGSAGTDPSPGRLAGFVAATARRHHARSRLRSDSRFVVSPSPLVALTGLPMNAAAREVLRAKCGAFTEQILRALIW